MLRTLCVCALAVALMAESAQARGSRRGSPAAPSVSAQPAAPAPVAQAQRPQAMRSFSYAPGVTSYPAYGNFGFVDSGTRWAPAFRPAAAKARGNY
jgi:hypothetical protein